ncbi:MAG TPA: glycerophosphodiester phosphodiesterase [Sporichthyaceae bacterium]
MVTAIAHRAPASAAGCAELVALGVSVFEIDVQAIDGVLVSSHFLPLGGLGRLRRDRWSLTVRRRAAREIALAGAVAMVPEPARILLDLKTDTGEAAAELVEYLVADGLDPARCLVSTKGWHTLEALRGHGYPTWRTVADPTALATVLSGAPVPDAAVTVQHRLLTAEVVARLHAAGTPVMTWTVNDSARATALIDLGVDGVTSDSVEVLRRVAASR